MAAKKEVDFGQIAETIFKNFGEHEKDLKELCLKKSLMSLEDFYEYLQNEFKTINSDSTPQKECGSVSDYAELFKALDEYPANLQKPKRRELQRANSTILKGSTINLAENINTSSTSLNLSKLEEQPHQLSASEIYNDFKKFQQKLRRAQAEIKEFTKVETEYFTKLNQLDIFAQQLEKIMPTGDQKFAFNSAEQQKLIAIAANMERLNFVRENNCLFQQPIEGANIVRLRSLIDVLTYTLMQIG